ncbi:FlgO family outer membrane protein [Spirosoma litoris]
MKRVEFFLVLSYILISINSQAQADFKPQLKKLADDLTQQLRQRGNMRLAVANFTDQQDNVTELGRYLAQQFSVYLIRNGLDVLDRSKMSYLMEENKMSAKGLLDPKNQAALGQLASIQLIVFGTTTPSDKSIELVITATDIGRGSGIAATDGSIPRTSSLNDLMRSTVKPGGGNGSLQEVSTMQTVTPQDKNIGYVLMGDKTMPLPKESCLTNMGNFGKVCFENILPQPIVLYRLVDKSSSNSYTPNILIGKNARNCTALLYTGAYDKIRDGNYEFYFHTTEDDEDKRRYGQMPVVVEGCKAVIRVINSDRLFLSKTKPN